MPTTKSNKSNNDVAAADDTTEEPPLFLLDDDQLDQDAKDVLNARIVAKTRKGYERDLVRFMLWVFDNLDKYGDMLNPSTLEALTAAHQKDKERRTAAGKPSKMRDHIRNKCYEFLRAIVKGDESTFPIKLENITFANYSRFLGTFRKVVKGKDSTVSGGKVIVRLRLSSFEAHCSALAYLFTECDKDRDATCPGLFNELSKYKKGTRRMSAKERKKHGLRTTEGKKHLPFKGYVRLAEILFKSENKEYIQAHTFLVLDWNMMSRSESVIESNIDLISQQKDCINIDLGKTKCDQEGLKYVDYPLHLYSNPQEPCICPVLALCRLLICHPMILQGQRPLFEGVSQYDRFHSIFKEIVSSDEYRHEFVALGISPEDFGTHSIRKGSATLCATGCIVAPPISSICLRACWALPGVLNRYIKIADAGDQHVGKVVCGRDRMSVDFTESLPYFDFSDFVGAEYVARHATVNAWIKDRMPVDARSNEGVFSLFKACIASLAYHKQKGNLDSIMHSNCLVRSSAFWMEDIPYADNVTTKYPWNKTRDTPELTGLPPDVNLLVEVQTLKEELAQMREDLKTNFKEVLVNELDTRNVGGANHTQSNIILEKLDALLEKADKICDARPSVSTHRPLDDYNDEEFNSDDFVVEFEFDSQDPVLEGVDAAAVTPLIKDALARKRRDELMKRRNYKCGVSSTGKLTPVPPRFTFPKMNMHGLITKWLIGDKQSNIPPFRFLHANPNFVAHVKNGKKAISKMGAVMHQVMLIGKSQSAWQSDGRWDGGKVETLYSKVYPLLDRYLRTEGKHGDKSTAKSRREEQSWRTCYNKMSEQGLLGDRTRKAKKTNNAPEAEKKRKKGASANSQQQKKKRMEEHLV